MPNLPPPAYCPGCSLPLVPGAPAAACPRCALPLTGQVPQQVREIDAELWRLEARRTELLSWRGQLLAGLRAPGSGGGGRADTAPRVPPAGPPGRSTAPPPAPPTARNVLLALGGVLLAVAVTAFTLVSWGRLGIGGRAAVLGALTLLGLGVPAALTRRGLTATAEAVASLGLVLLLLDAYALHRVALPEAGDAGYAAVAAAVTAALWAGYGAALPRLRGPLPVAVCLAQLPLPLWALSAGGGPYAFSWALLATAAGDAAVALWCAGRRAVAVTALAAGCALGVPGLLTAAVLALTARGWAGSAHSAALLAAAAAVLLYAARRLARITARTDAAAPSAVAPAAVVPAAVAGLAVLVAGGGALRGTGALPEPGWPVLGFLLCAMALGAVPVRERSVAAGLRLASAAVCAGAALWALPAVARLVLGPLGWVFGVWDGAPQGARAAVAPGLGWPYGMALPAVLGALAAVSAAVGWGPGAGARVPREWRARARGGALVAAAAAAAVLPVVLDLPYRVAVVLLLAEVVVLLAVSVSPVRPHPAAPDTAGSGTAWPAPVTALAAAVAVGGWSLAEPAMTVAVLGTLAAAFAGAAVAARASAPVGPAVAVAAVLWSGAFAAAVPLSLGAPPHRAAFAVLGAAVATVPLAARLRARPTGAPVECAGYAVAAAAVALTVAEPVALSLALALCGVAAGGVALRAERRPVAAYAGGLLLVLAWWVRLGSWEVTSPEAYTLPVTIPALAVGHLHRIRPEVSSWAAYGPGLATTLVPSLVAVWLDTHWLRPLLLGTAALALTVLGARSRLKAPLLMGGGTAALVAVHELAPYVVQVAGLLPRWAPPAAAGVLLLALGATYERRLREARRLRRAVGRMR
ncbi:SCO7613 C-terminal domain-containing membrane protein [Streptomyces sp. KL2]|uniref:SCO7613 C-terminal domain-containing membrane protein n=1 Tax=Streptomyces sp. KL2 TaxID=3050126 RepID=UPI00397E4660